MKKTFVIFVLLLPLFLIGCGSTNQYQYFRDRAEPTGPLEHMGYAQRLGRHVHKFNPCATGQRTQSTRFEAYVSTDSNTYEGMDVRQFTLTDKEGTCNDALDDPLDRKQ